LVLWLASEKIAKETGDVLVDVDLVLQVGEVGGEKGLGPPTIWAVGLGKDDDFVAGNGIFDNLLSRHACYGRGGCETGEESPNGPAI